MSSLPGCSSGCRATMSDIAVSKWSCGSLPTARASSSCDACDACDANIGTHLCNDATCLQGACHRTSQGQYCHNESDEIHWHPLEAPAAMQKAPTVRKHTMDLPFPPTAVACTGRLPGSWRPACARRGCPGTGRAPPTAQVKELGYSGLAISCQHRVLPAHVQAMMWIPPESSDGTYVSLTVKQVNERACQLSEDTLHSTTS